MSIENSPGNAIPIEAAELPQPTGRGVDGDANYVRKRTDGALDLRFTLRPLTISRGENNNKMLSAIMKQATIRFPVVCPRCGTESLAELPVIVAAEALINNEGVQLRAPCQHGNWMASPTEMQQLREYIGAVFVDQQMSE